MPILAPAGRPIDGDAFHPTLVALGIAVVVALGWVVWEFWIRDKN